MSVTAERLSADQIGRVVERLR
ncbi:MAG: hypothetical protein V7646_231, partial [Pseudonocardia sp.]